MQERKDADIHEDRQTDRWMKKKNITNKSELRMVKEYTLKEETDRQKDRRKNRKK